MSVVPTSRPAEGKAGSPSLRAGLWVHVARGVAAGARGWVCRCGGGTATIVALGLGKAPLLLTVPVEYCRPVGR